jgi:hypothetical protein
MIHLKRIGLAASACLLGLAICVSAQTPVRVQKAELSINFGVAKGKLVTAGDYLVFVDDEYPESSFSIEKTNIKSWNEQEGIVTIDTNRPVKDRNGDKSRFAFRVDGPTTALTAWYREAPALMMARPGEAMMAKPDAAANKDAAKVEQKIYQARQKRFPMGTTDGRLIITEKLVHFEAADAKRSRQWELKDIRTIKQTGPYVLEIKPYVGDDYKLELLGEGMSPSEFKALSDRIASARVK